MTEKVEFSTVDSEFTCCEHTFTTKNSVSADEGEDKDTASPSVSVDVCTAQWVGYNEQGDEEDLLQVKLTKPLPYPIFSSNEVNCCIFRFIILKF